MDVDHIVPRSLGGPDHRWNFQVLESSVNRRFGNRFGLDKCVRNGLDRCVVAALATLVCGDLKALVSRGLIP